LPYSSEQSAAEQQQFKNAENAFVATGIYPYRSNFISNKDIKSSETTYRYEMPDDNVEDIEDEHSHVESALLVSDPDLPTLAS
jgi:hypothetical protein